MDKTRMCKRAASLLLSLVMMLSLLPTAAYATMADGVDTQGASVSENGTGVSDDSNSSGNTDDLQVEDSEGNGDTGAQQVGDSSGSGTAGDTTGAEGGADPTDSANENDSADPQDDGDAVMPVASSVVSTSEELVAAIAAASDGDTIMLGEGEFTTYGNTSPKKSLTFEGVGGKTVWTIGDLNQDAKGEGNGDCSFDGCETITFQNMTLKSDGADYRGFIRISNTVVKKCTLVGKTAYWGYETAKFENSTFNAPVGDYALWDYSTKAMTLEGCTFNISGKGVNVYVEQPSTDARTVEVNSCTVNSTKAGKAFLNIKNSTQAYDVTLSGTNTVTGLEANGTTGSALYQVETTKVTETTGNPVTVKQENTAGEFETVYEVKETVAETTMDLDAFIKAVEASGYNYDGNGVTVKWSPVTGCYDTREGHDCTAGNVKATGNTPKRVSADYAQYQLFSGLTQNVTIKNVKFVYEPAAFTICANSGWAGSGTVTNLAELQFENKGDVKLLDCSFDGVAVAVFNDIETASTAVHGCSFTNMTKAGGGYAIHYLKGGKIDVSENTFENVYRGMLVQSTVNKGTNIVNNNFSGIDATNSSCYMVKLLNVKDTDIVISGNTTAANSPVNVNVAYHGTDGAAIAVGDRISTIHTAETDGNSVKISTGGDQMTGYTAPSAAVEDASGITVDADGNVTVTLPAKTTSVAEVNGTEYKSLQAAIDAAGRKATVTLLADTRENVTIAEMMTLDLNGHTLNGGTEKGKPALTVTARVTVKDGSAAQTGTIMREDTAENSGVSSHYVIDVQGAGWLTFESGNVKNNSGNTQGKGASLVRVGDDRVAKYPGLNIKGGTFTQDNFIVIKVDSGDLFLNGGTLNSANSYAIEDWHRATIKGGTVNGTVAAWTYSGGHNSDLTISGGTVNGNVASVSYYKTEGKLAKVSISGGTVNGTLGTYTYGNGLIPINDAAKATIAVTGGTFKENPTKYVVEDSAITPNGDGTYGVAKAYLAKVGDTSYYTMDEAFKAQTASGEAIVLLRDYTTGSTFNSGTVARTVDLNGHTWTCTGTDANSAAFEINNPNATLIVKNGKVVSSQLVGLIPSANSKSGTITYDNSTLVFDGVEMTTNARSGIETNGNNTNDTVTLKDSTLNVPNGFGIYFPSSGTLTIDNSVINAKTMGVQVCAGSLNVTGAGTAINVSGDGIPKTINDGAIEDGAAISIVNRAGYKDLAEIKVEGGKFTAKGDNAAVKAYDWANQTENAFTQSDKVSISGGTFSSAVDKSLCADGYIPTQNADGTYGVKEGKYVAEIGSQGYESLTEAIGAAQDGQTVTLLADAAEDVVISKSITLDLGGKTLTNTNAGKATISVTGGTVTVKNGNVVGGTGYYNIEVTKEGSNANLTLTDVTATAGNTGSSMIDNWGTLTITSGTYTGGLNVVKSEEGSVLNISGGTFTRKTAPRFGITGTVLVYGTTTITGGTFNEKSTSTNARVVVTGRVKGYDSITYVKGGTFNGNGNNVFHHLSPAQADDSFEVSGGTFNKSIPDYYCADGFIPTKNAGGTYGVKEGQYVAKVGSKKYETLADAIRLAAKGQTVTLLADVADCGSLTISKNITLDGGGHTISGNSSISVNMPGNAAADVTIKNVNFKDIANGNKLSAFYFSQVKGKLTITGCTFDSIEYEAIQVTPMEGAEVNVSNNVFKAKADGTQVRHIHIEMAYGSGFDCEGQNIKLTVTDNQLHGAVCGDASMGIWWVGTGSTLKVDGNYMEHPETVSITLANSGVHYNRGDLIYPARSQADVDVDDLMPAVIVADKASGESKIKAYSTLAEAVAAAQDGQTVRLLADVAESSIKVNANITIDLNKMTVTGSFVTYGEVTIQNGTIDVPDGKTNYAYGKLTLADVDITGKAASSSLLSVNYNGSVTIDKDSTIVADSAKGDYPAVFIKGQNDSGKTYAPELNIYGTVQSAKTPAIQGNGTDRGVSHVNVFEGAVVKSESLAVYLPQPCEVNITGGLVEGYCGIGIKSGTLNISGGTVRGVANDNVIGDEYSQTNGISYDGSAIMIDSYIGYAGQVQINISGNAVVESKYSTAIREIGNDKSQTNLVGLDITGGTVLGAKDTDAVLVRDVTAKDVNISGGEFSSIVKKEYCAPGFTPVTTANSEGRYGVEIGKFTVKVTSRTTGSDSPVANVAGGGSDITYAEGITVTASAISGYNFVGWFVNEYTGTPYSTNLTCEVKPTDDWTMIAVYEPISGGKFWLTVTASEFTVNGGAVQDSYLYEQFAVGASVTVNFTGSENFLYWVNASNKVVSTEKSYTFIMGSETTLKAVYGKARQNQATVVFISHSDQIISSKAYTTSDTIQFPVPPIKMGCTFTGWSMTEAEIRAAMANNSGIIQVRARYTEPSIACTVTVVYPEGTDNQVVNAVVGKAIDVTAKDIEGKTFSYWTDDKGTVLGYTKTLKLAPSGDMTVKAVYDEAAKAKPVITISEVSATTANESYVVTFMATRAVPDGYKVVKQGILWSRDAVCGEDGAAAYMQFDSNGKLPTGVNAYIGNSLELNGVTRLDITTKYNDRTFYGRGYMVLESDAGELLYIYTNTIASGSYDSLTE